MKISTEGLIALIGHEGIVLSRYKDSVGVWTIGVGHTAAAGGINPATFKGTLSMSGALDLLRKDIVKYENGVNAAVKIPLKQHEFDALVSFHYNTGAIGKASFVRKLNSGDRAGALKSIMDWRKPKDIIPRRTAERDLFKTGNYPSPIATVYPADANGKVLWNKGARVNVRDLLKATRPIIPATTPKPTPESVDGASTPPAKSGLAAFFAAILSLFKKGK